MKGGHDRSIHYNKLLQKSLQEKQTTTTALMHRTAKTKTRLIGQKKEENALQKLFVDGWARKKGRRQ